MECPFYDEVLGVELIEDAMCVAFANYIALVMGAEIFMENIKKCLERLNQWAKEHELCAEEHRSFANEGLKKEGPSMGLL